MSAAERTQTNEDQEAMENVRAFLAMLEEWDAADRLRSDQGASA